MRTRSRVVEGEVVPADRALAHGRGIRGDGVRCCGRAGEETLTRGQDREASPEPIYKHDNNIEQQDDEKGPAQPPLVLDSTLMLRELITKLLARLNNAPSSCMLQGLITRLLARLDSAPLSCIIPGISSSPIAVGATPPV